MARKVTFCIEIDGHNVELILEGKHASHQLAAKLMSRLIDTVDEFLPERHLETDCFVSDVVEQDTTEGLGWSVKVRIPLLSDSLEQDLDAEVLEVMCNAV